MNGVHYQNAGDWEEYLAGVGAGRLPLVRAYRPTADERLIRELILQLKLGSVEPEYFRQKFGADILEAFRPALERLQEREMLQIDDGRIQLTRQGLLQVDLLLPEFFAPEYRHARYT
jgi:oxygen-independent coproporphyrinogen-3 oxidase